jgi:beta-lactamase class C
LLLDEAGVVAGNHVGSANRNSRSIKSTCFFDPIRAVAVGATAMRLATAASIVLLLCGPATGGDKDAERIVTAEIGRMVPADGAGGVAVALRLDGKTAFFNYGWADQSGERRITSDTLFNLASLRKVFETTLLAQAVRKGELRLDDPASKYIVELDKGRDIGRVTLGELATHTSGLLLPQDHPPWPDWGYTLPEFIRTLNAWRAEKPPGQQHLYTHAGFIVLQLALERRFGAPIDELIDKRLLRPLGMSATVLARGDDSPRGHLPPELKERAAQGYGDDSEPVGKPGDQTSYYHWPGTGQMYSCAHDMAAFLAANLGEQPAARSLREAMALAQREVMRIGPNNWQALAWEIISGKGPQMVEKYGGLNNASAYIGMVPSHKLGIVILGNRGNQYPNEVGRRILLKLAGA